jgi:general secretion pathway protein G
MAMFSLSSSKTWCLIAISVLLIGVSLYALPRDGTTRRVSSEVQQLRLALLMYHEDTGIWPNDVEELCEGRHSKHPKRYLDGEPYYERRGITDIWGRKYLLFRNERGMRVVSFGEDGLPGGEGEDGDVSSDVISGKIWQYKPEPIIKPWWIVLVAASAGVGLTLLLQFAYRRWKRRRETQGIRQTSQPE